MKMQAVPLPPQQPRPKAENMIADSNVVFQRILSTCWQSPEDLEEAHHSLALFDDDGFLRDPS